MNVLVFGATGPTGQEVVKQALSRGHAVTAFVRRPHALSISDERLRIVAGDTTRDEPKVAEAVRGQDVVVSALGRRNSFRSDGLIARSMELILPSMERAGVRRTDPGVRLRSRGLPPRCPVASPHRVQPAAHRYLRGQETGRGRSAPDDARLDHRVPGAIDLVLRLGAS
jgi:hypothetical protein